MEKQRFNKNGITLIALVVTIVVLLILAGVSLNLVIGNNGIIAKAQDAQIITRAASAEDEVELWKGNNYIAQNSNQSSESKESMLQRLKDKKLVYEDEIDRNNEIITIKKKDGTVVKEINYGGIVINISKTPMLGVVLVRVTSVDGLMKISNDQEYDTFIEQIEKMDEGSKKELIKNLDIMFNNKLDGTNIKTFEELLAYYYEKGYIIEKTEEAYWRELDTSLSNRGSTYTELICDYISELFYDEQTDSITTYAIINPDNSLSDTYIATEDGTYTFTVKDLITGKNYTKTVEVANIVEEAEINIRKTPETEKASAVFVKVSSVDGLAQISNETECNSFKEIVKAMNEGSKKELIKNLNIMINNKFNGTNIKKFEELLKYYYGIGHITEETEEAYWRELDTSLSYTGSTYTELICDWIFELLNDEQTDSITVYEIINPDNALSDEYIATENGTYTFTIKDLLTGKNYTKSVEVTNIDLTLRQYEVANLDTESYAIGLKSISIDEPTTFSEAYIVYNGTTVDITSNISLSEDGTYNYIFGDDISIFTRNEQYNHTFIIIKDGIQYIGNADIIYPE